MYHNVLQVFNDVLLCLRMFSELRNDRYCHIGGCQSLQGLAITPQGSTITPQGSVITLQKSAMTSQGLLISAKVIPC